MLSTSFIQIFDKVKYKFILGLTATLERLDGRHEICEKYCPVCDNIPITECLINGWVSPYKEYLVLIDVDDYHEYEELNKDFTSHFEYFNFDYPRIQKCLGKTGFVEKSKIRDERCINCTEEQRKQVFKDITMHSQMFMTRLKQRKTFINNHPKKIEVTKHIIEMRPFSKIITFSNSITMAKKIGGTVYTGNLSKREEKNILEKFKNETVGILSTVKKCDAGKINII